MYSQLTRGKIYKNLQGGEWINEPLYFTDLDWEDVHKHIQYSNFLIKG